MTERKVHLSIIGCGNIADPYIRDLLTYPELELVGLADIDASRTEALAGKYALRAYSTVSDLLADDGVDLVVNLTIHHAHAEVSAACLEAGKHVFSEKPLAMTYEDAQRLLRLAGDNGLRLGGAPFTFMGEAQETARKWIRDGKLGTVRVAYAEVNWGRIETWHPVPGSFYDVGALFDVGVYPLANLTAIFGPAKRVWAYGTVLYPDRLTKKGVPFHVSTPDFAVTMIEMANGPLVRLTTNFYVSQRGKQMGIEFHGDRGSLNLGSWFLFDAPVEFGLFNETYAPVPLVKEPPQGIRWGRGVLDMAQAILEERPHRASAEQAAHIVEILCAASESMNSGQPVTVTSTFTPPAPMEWAEMTFPA